MVKKSLKETLVERKQQHGSFIVHSKISQGLKEIVKSGPSYAKLTDIQKEGLEMILHKVARIVAGDPNHKDHWKDIAGYSTLVEESIQD